jgi:ketosteroid isomerase-like protein
MRRWLLSCLVLAGCAGARSAGTPTGSLDAAGFRTLMERVAAGWREGNAAKAVECFTEDTLYEEPPRKQFHSGRADLYEFFGGEAGTEKPMHMTWHHLVFDPVTQVGAGEYTFRLNRQYHGVVMVKLRDGRIARWREYQTESSLSFEEFSAATRF